MKIKLLAVGLGMFFLNGAAFAELDPLKNYDNFNAKKYNGCKYCINSEKWKGNQKGDYNTEAVREIKGKKLRMTQRSWGEVDDDEGTEEGRNRVIFRDSADFRGACITPRIKKHEEKNCATNDSHGHVRIRYVGNFYDHDSADDGGEDGLIYAGIQMLRHGDGISRKKNFDITAWAVESEGEDGETEVWTTYDDEVNDPDLDFGTFKNGHANKKAICIGYDSTRHELVFSYGNDVRTVNAVDHGLPTFDSNVDPEFTWHVIEARTDAENCMAGPVSSFVDGDVDNVKVRRFVEEIE